MSEPVVFGERPSAAPASGARVETFDPPMCCPTGVCGPTIDPAVLDANEMILTLQGESIHVARLRQSAHSSQRKS